MERSRLKQIIKEELDRALSESRASYRVPTDAAGYPLRGGGGSAMGGPIPAAYRGKRSGPRWRAGDRNAIDFDRAFQESENTPMMGPVDAGDLRGANVAGTYNLTFDVNGPPYGATVDLTFFEDGSRLSGMVSDKFKSQHDAVGAAIEDAKSRY